MLNLKDTTVTYEADYEFLGQEHFINGAERMLHHEPSMAQYCFNVLVARVLRPFDIRQPDFSGAGLIILPRSAVGLADGQDPSGLAIETWSLLDNYSSGALIDATLATPYDIQLGPAELDFIASLTELVVLPVRQ